MWFVNILVFAERLFVTFAMSIIVDFDPEVGPVVTSVVKCEDLVDAYDAALVTSVDACVCGDVVASDHIVCPDCSDSIVDCTTSLLDETEVVAVVAFVD